MAKCIRVKSELIIKVDTDEARTSAFEYLKKNEGDAKEQLMMSSNASLEVESLDIADEELAKLNNVEHQTAWGQSPLFDPEKD